MNRDHEFFQVNKLRKEQKRSSPQMVPFFLTNLGEDPKKKVFTKNGTFVFPQFKWRPALKCTPESNYCGDADVDRGAETRGNISPQ